MLFRSIVPSVLIGVPLGSLLIRHVRAETFRRVCMSFDAWIVAFGVSTIFRDLKIVESANAFLFLAVVVLIDAFLLWRFFRVGHPETAAAPVRVRAAGSAS